MALWLNGGRSARQAGQELGVDEKHLYLWKKIHAPRPPETQTQMESELAALRRENAHLRRFVCGDVGILQGASFRTAGG